MKKIVSKKELTYWSILILVIVVMIGIKIAFEYGESLGKVIAGN